MKLKRPTIPPTKRTLAREMLTAVRGGGTSVGNPPWRLAPWAVTGWQTLCHKRADRVTLRPGVEFVLCADRTWLTLKPITEIRTKLREYGLARVENALTELALPCVRLVTKRANESLPATDTRIGGDPTLPVELTWPQRDGRAMSFLGQVNLDQVARLGLELALPLRGMLSFFLDVDGLAENGWEPQGALVLHFNDSAGVVRPPPAGAHRYSACHTQLVPTWSMPQGSADCPFVHQLHLTDEEAMAYSDFSSLADEHLGAPFGHQLLGYGHGCDQDVYLANEIDNSDRRDELLAVAFPLGKPRDRTEALDHLMASARSWRTLMQFVDDDASGTGWWERGVSFMIRDTALSSGNMADDVCWRLA